jgi:hypothetical protein
MSSKTIWTSEKISNTLVGLQQGDEIDHSCFYEKDPELRASNILFQLTEDEEDEFVTCSQDVTYFVEKYCKFMTDKGRMLVELRDFQEDIFNTLGEEVWVDELDDWGPKVRNYILMASRQTGKCFSFDTEIVIKFNSAKGSTKIKISDLYNIVNKKLKKNKKQKIINFFKGVFYNLNFKKISYFS